MKLGIALVTLNVLFLYSNGILFNQNCSSDREKLLKFKAEGREFAKFLRSLEKCIQYLFILEVSNI